MAIEKRDAEGNILAIGGGRWTPAMGERQKWWYANEGLRISRFIADVELQVKTALDSNAPPVAERVVTEMGATLIERVAPRAESRRSTPFAGHAERPSFDSFRTRGRLSSRVTSCRASCNGIVNLLSAVSANIELDGFEQFMAFSQF